MALVMGIDGGRTKTSSLICTLKGEIVGRGQAGPLAYLTDKRGKRMACCSVARAIKEALRQAGLKRPHFRIVLMGLAGVGDESSGSRDIFKDLVKGLISTERILVVNDGEISLAGALAGKEGVVVAAGTGAIAFGKGSKGRRARSSGWGYLFGDEGSAFAIGRRALMAISRSFDLRGPKTKLKQAILRRWGLKNIYELCQYIYGRPLEVRRIASLAEVVSSAAQKGDKVARDILKEAGVELGLAVGAVIKSLGLGRREVKVAYTGSVFKSGDLILQPFRRTVREVAPRAEILPARYESVVGAVILALKECGVEVDEKILGNIEMTLKLSNYL